MYVCILINPVFVCYFVIQSIFMGFLAILVSLLFFYSASVIERQRRTRTSFPDFLKFLKETLISGASFNNSYHCFCYFFIHLCSCFDYYLLPFSSYFFLIYFIWVMYIRYLFAFSTAEGVASRDYLFLQLLSVSLYSYILSSNFV